MAAAAPRVRGLQAAPYRRPKQRPIVRFNRYLAWGFSEQPGEQGSHHAGHNGAPRQAFQQAPAIRGSSAVVLM